jgi:multisubunit Na+/H+ antiporter MnhG subunit
MAVIVHLLVWLGVAVELVCCVGLAAMRNAIDRLHYTGAATVAGPTLVAAAVCFEEGLFTSSGLNVIAVALLLALLGGALGVATARTIRLRERGTLEPSPAERERGS